MAGFLQKLRVVTLGAAHDLLDKEIDLNSPSALRQYVRDLEDALSKMNNEANVQGGGLRTLRRELGDLKTSIDAKKVSMQRDIDAGNTERARQTGVLVVTLQQQYDRKQKDLADQQATSTSLDTAVTKLETKHTDMVNRVRELESLDRQTKAKEQSASALNAASRLTSTGASISIDDIESKMRTRNDVASERFDRAMAATDLPEDETTTSAVDDLMASMQKKPEKKSA